MLVFPVFMCYEHLQLISWQYHSFPSSHCLGRGGGDLGSFGFRLFSTTRLLCPLSHWQFFKPELVSANSVTAAAQKPRSSMSLLMQQPETYLERLKPPPGCQLVMLQQRSFSFKVVWSRRDFCPMTLFAEDNFCFDLRESVF